MDKRTMSDELAPSYLELSKTAFQKNVSFFKDLIGPDVTFCSVIKGNAYGHGINQFVPMAEDCGINYFAVFSADEAAQAYKAATGNCHIMIMGMINNDAIEWAIERDISFFVFERNRLKAAVNAAKKLGKPARIHLHLETGMNRLGLEKHKLPEVIDTLHAESAHLIIEGLCTHYAGAESVSNHVRVTEQIERFNELCAWLKQKGIEGKYRHSACSAAVLNYPETRMDLVRVGISQYGFWPNRETYMNFIKKNHTDSAKPFEDPLDRVLSWKSRVMSIKHVEAGEFIGYGNVYLTSRDQTIATVPIGYSHGFGRNLTNVGIVLINGERAPVAGLVNMNLLTIDVTDIDNVQKGDEVVIIGYQQDQEMTLASFSEMLNNMNYEVLVRLPANLPRTVVE
ncbi:alanine racemase [Aliifodinibius sp. S!AR15-10]|uniref:alanine racemase n=1 Tax=Aliifodinibius sp. S!AR15-10 TaxID=2950437 RepID=UPI00285856CA|nr:alanine racemase [Aliifodinibius sp. S!AR15-10]MDR8394412.1 alanine racemase [Aliifodinibius sp. S!AR15-10]